MKPDSRSFFTKAGSWAVRNVRDKGEYLTHLLNTKNGWEEWKEALNPDARAKSVKEIFKSIMPVFPAGKDWDAVAKVQNQNRHESMMIFKEADEAHNRRVDLLGSGMVNINMNGGNGIDWHRDHKSGVEWPRDTFYKFTKTVYKKGADIKWVRELSRCAHLVRLGQAYRMKKAGINAGSFTAEEYAQELLNQVESWIDSNPWPWGSNWQCSMDVGLRAMNWLLALDLISDSVAVNKHPQLEKILGYLWLHGKHLYANPEKYEGIAATNHYIADLVSQITLGLCLHIFDESDKWAGDGLKALEDETGYQVLPESGVCFEASTGYHRLDLEMLLWPWLVLVAKQKEVPSWLTKCLQRMVAASVTLLKSNGEAPAFGDQDSARSLSLYPRENLYHGYIAGFIPENETQVPEKLWSVGTGKVPHWLGGDKSATGEFSFNDVGWHGIRHNGWDLSIVCGPINTLGSGGHSHNDQLSFDLAVDGINIVGDPGTYVYSADPKQRNLFRSTKMHSTVSVDNMEQCAFSGLFARKDCGVGRLEKMKRINETSFLFEGNFSGQYFHKRRLELTTAKGELKGCDEISRIDGYGGIFWRLVLCPGVSVSIVDSSTAKLSVKGLNFYVEMVDVACEAGQGFLTERIFYSTSYGKKEESLSLVFPLKPEMEYRWLLKKEND